MNTFRTSKGPRSAVLSIVTLLTMALVTACGGSSSSSSSSGGSSAVASTPAIEAASEAASASTDTAASGDPLKVAFVYLASIDPAESWNEAHHTAQLQMEEALGDKVDVTVVEGVPEGPASLKTFEDLARQGYDVILGTTFGYMDQMLEVAGKYPDAVFLNAAGYKTADNMGNYYGAEEQARYLSGMIAGGMSKTGKLGYVAAFPIPLVLRGINAFTLGAQKVNPDATTTVVWTSSWFDPNGEKQAAAALLQTGIDVISNETDSPGTGQAAEDAGAYWLGSYSDQSSFAPTAYLGSQCWDFSDYYTEQVQAVIDGTWKSEAYWGTLGNGMVKFCGPSDKVPAELAATVATTGSEIADGSYDIWAGPIFDQAGKEIVAEGAAVSADEQAAMNWFVKGVIGDLPK
jgi:basic membrane protein A